MYTKFDCDIIKEWGNRIIQNTKVHYIHMQIHYITGVAMHFFIGWHVDSVNTPTPTLVWLN